MTRAEITTQTSGLKEPMVELAVEGHYIYNLHAGISSASGNESFAEDCLAAVHLSASPPWKQPELEDTPELPFRPIKWISEARSVVGHSMVILLMSSLAPAQRISKRGDCFRKLTPVGLGSIYEQSSECKSLDAEPANLHRSEIDDALAIPTRVK
ncbi:hypothetical protein B0F90DRAFT_1816297 [Multifurca ochricompacta]|uniref:Uncharacterized protein n=1 Tax=Multifurca ochricompacta TaxID=376703 RepID=A0AAD4M6W5_9AGAM|nr:hypothetical protein B0F90DRAFT_1816297 [Multifurca ochricompacta]